MYGIYAQPRVADTKRCKSPSHILNIFYLTLTTDHCRYVRRPGEDYAIKNRDPSLVKSRQEGGFEEVDFVVDSFVELAGAMKGL